MIRLMEGLPDGVIGIEAVGKVTADDYTDVAAPALRRAREHHTKLRLIHVLGTEFTGMTGGGLLNDAQLGLAHPRSWERIAVVTDLDSVRALVRGAGWSIPGQMKLFGNAEVEDAKAWAAEGLDESP